MPVDPDGSWIRRPTDPGMYAGENDWGVTGPGFSNSGRAPVLGVTGRALRRHELVEEHEVLAVLLPLLSRPVQSRW